MEHAAMMAPNVLSAKALSLLLVAGLSIISLHCNGDGGGVTPPEGPSIGLSETSLSFSGTQGADEPAAQTVTITNAGNGTLSDLAAAVSYTSGQPTGWLSASLSETTAPSTLTLTALTGTLPPGTYTATVAVSSAVAGNSPQQVGVTFTLAPSPFPLIALSSTSQGFTAEQGGEDPAAQAVAVGNAGAGTLDGLTAEVSYATGEPSGWLTAELSSTTAPAVLTLTAATGSLGVGEYGATVSIASPVAGNTPQTLAITFAVTEPPEGLLYSVGYTDDGLVGSQDAGLSTINPRTGVGRFIGRLGGSQEALYTGAGGMAVTLDHPLERSVMYVWNNIGDGTVAGVQNGTLLTVSFVTGEGTPVSADTPSQSGLNAIAVSPDDALYGGYVSSLYSLDPATGLRTLIGSLGPGHQIRAMDFHCNGTLYGVSGTGAPSQLVTINTSTGAASAVGTLSEDVGVVTAIAFSRAGSLIGGAAGPLGDILFDIDIATGQVSNVRPISGENVNWPEGMGFVRSAFGCRT